MGDWYNSAIVAELLNILCLRVGEGRGDTASSLPWPSLAPGFQEVGAALPWQLSRAEHRDAIQVGGDLDRQARERVERRPAVNRGADRLGPALPEQLADALAVEDVEHGGCGS